MLRIGVKGRSQCKAICHLLSAALFAFFAASVAAYDLVHSPGPDRAGATALDGAEVADDLYAFLDTDSGIRKVVFSIDGNSYHTEGAAPWDLEGTERNDDAKPFDTTQLVDGLHDISAQVTLTDGSVLVLSAAVTVDNSAVALEASPASFNEALHASAVVEFPLTVSASDGSAAEVSLTSDQSWLTLGASVGTAPLTSTVFLDATALAAGPHSGLITATADGLDAITIPVQVDLVLGSGSYQLLVSDTETRTTPDPLAGQPLSGNVYIFTGPDTGVAAVDFYLDDPIHAGAPIQQEGVAPFDFAGTGTDGNALPFDTASLAEGTYPITARLLLADGSIDYTSGDLSVGSSGGGGFTLTPDNLSFQVIEPDTTASQTLNVDHVNGADEIYTLTASEPWLSVSPDMEIAPSSHTVTVDTTGLAVGSYQGAILIEGSTSVSVPVSLEYRAATSSDYVLMVSDFSSRSASVSLQGQTLAGDAYIHTQPEVGVRKVTFYLNSTETGSVYKVEQAAPFDFAGTGSSGEALPFDTTTLADGSHFITAVVTESDGDEIITDAGFAVANAEDPAFTLSPSSVAESMLVSDPPVEVTVYLGLNASADGSSPDYAIETTAPWVSISPSSGVAPDSLTVTLDAGGLISGTYETTAIISSTALADVTLPIFLSVNDDAQQALVASPDQLGLSVSPDSGVHTTSFDLSTSDDSTAYYDYSSSATWLWVENVSGAAPETVTVKVDSTGLALGSHQASLEFTAGGYISETVTVTVEVTDGTICTPVPCTEVKVELPYILEFDQDMALVKDGLGNGTGFTYLLPSSKVESYRPENIELDTTRGVLNVTSTAGIFHLDVNNQENPLSVGFPGPNQITKISTVLNYPEPGSGNYEQAGLWFGYNEDNYVKLVYNSFPGDPLIEFAHEEGGIAVRSVKRVVGDLSNSLVELELIADPSTRTVTAYYTINGSFRAALDSFNVQTEMFSFDAAGIDPQIGTRSFAGLMTTHRHGSTPITYEFERFAVEATEAEAIETTYEFVRSSHNVNFPTSMVWGPDGKLYVTELFGTIHALTYDDNLNVVSDELITSLTDTLGDRLTLGITVFDDDPSDNNVFSLWVASSSPSVNSGVANSSSVTRLSGPNFDTVEQVITGLPRAIANHAVNSLHFGPDNQLYIAVGGNTGAGSVVDVVTEFGDRAEQPLSAAIVVADVFSAGFDGTCANDADIYGPAPCDVVNYATGLRNSYDFVFHSNSHMYAADNGLGVAGAYPPSPTPDCSGVSDATPVEEGGNNPGPQTDLLMRIQEGLYYGHPNPSRDECVFKDGSLQGVAPLPNYEPPIGDLGMNASANGMTEYTSGRACGNLQGDLMVVRYSLGDDIVRVQLSDDGFSVDAQEVLATGFNDPLPLSEHNGDLFVGEFGSGQVTALRIQPVPCWSTGQPMPEAVLDAGSVALDGLLYSVGGKLSSGPINTVYRYNPETDQWLFLTSKPGSAVENPAVTTDGQSIFVMGGSTGPFSGAVSEVWRYDPGANSWTALADMPIPLGGVSAQWIDGLIYVAGGMNGQGASVDSLQVYDVASDSWSAGPAMGQVRDNAGTAVVDGKLYVLSGRHRLSDGTTVSEGVASMEVFDPATQQWATSAMPRGRRAFVVGRIDAKLQIVGGESNPGAPGGLFSEVDVYDPATASWDQLDNAPEPRHGAGFGTINNQLIVTGGGAAAGSSFTDTTQKLSLD